MMGVQHPSFCVVIVYVTFSTGSPSFYYLEGDLFEDFYLGEVCSGVKFWK